MAKVTIGRKACAVNPLKMSQPIGGALARFLSEAAADQADDGVAAGNAFAKHLGHKTVIRREVILHDRQGTQSDEHLGDGLAA